MMSYTTINGKKYDGELMALVTKLTRGPGAGYLSKSEAKELFEVIKLAESPPKVRNATVKYMDSHYRWMDGANDWFHTAVNRWEKTH